MSIKIHTRDPGILRGAQTAIAILRDPDILPMQHVDARVTGCIGTGDFQGAVSRTIIRNDEFEIRKGLAEDAFYRLDYETFRIVGWHYDADHGPSICIRFSYKAVPAPADQSVTGRWS